MTSTEFIDYHVKTFPKFNEENFVRSWNSILLDFPKYRLDFIQNIQKSGKYKIYLLSNTNDLHISWVKENIAFYKAFKSCFKEFYLSYDINLRKPDEDIFKFVLEQNSLKAEETLFIDDTLEHINSAENLNIQTWHLQAGVEDVVDLFHRKDIDF